MTHVCVRSRSAIARFGVRQKARREAAQNVCRGTGSRIFRAGSALLLALVRDTRPCNAQGHLCHVWAKRHLCAQCHLCSGQHECPERTDLFPLASVSRTSLESTNSTWATCLAKRSSNPERRRTRTATRAVASNRIISTETFNREQGSAMTGDRLGNCYVTYAEPVIYGARERL